MILDSSLRKQSFRLIEKKLNEQVKLINDLKQLGASSSTIQQEILIYKELESVLFNYFKRDIFNKLKSSKNNVPSKNFSKNRAFSTSLYSYDDQHLKKTMSSTEEINQPSKLSVNSMKNRSSTFSVSQLLKENPSSPLLSEEKLNSSFDHPDSLDHTLLVNKKSYTGRSSYNKKNSKTDIESETTISVSPSAPPVVSLSNTEPKIDFELDVKIFFNSGKCVLHTKDQVKPESNNYADVDVHVANSPTLSTGNNHYLPVKNPIVKSRSGNKLSRLHNNRSYPSIGLNPDFTVFLIPGLDIQLAYSSKSVFIQSEDEQAHFKNPNNLQGMFPKCFG